MKKKLRSVFAILMTLVIAITALPTMEVKAEDRAVTIDSLSMQVSETDPTAKTTLTLTDSQLNDSIYFKADVSFTNINKDEVNYIHLVFENEYGGLYVTLFSNADGSFVGTMVADTSYKSGTYALTSADLFFYEGDRMDILNSFTNVPAITVSNTISDQNDPVISNVTLNENGQKVEQTNGTITISAKVEDASTISIVKACLSSTEGYHEVELTYDAQSGLYSTTQDISAWENVVWRVADVRAKDIFGNENVHIVEDVYFIVTENGIYQEATFDDVEFCFIDYSSDTYIELALDDVPQFTTIQEILGEKATLSNPELGQFLGWKDEDTGKIYGANDEILIERDNYRLYFQAVYEKQYVYLRTEYLDENGDYESDEIKLVVPSGTTYADLVPYLPALPTGAKEWKCSDVPESELDTVVESDYAWFEAVYDNYPVTVTQIYVVDNESGQEVKVVKTQKSYPAGTTMATVYNDFLGNPTDASTQYAITGWRDNYSAYEDLDDATVNVYRNAPTLTAEYTDKLIFSYSYNYITENDGVGKEIRDMYYAFVDKNTLNTLDDVENYFLNTVLPTLNVSHYDDAVFKEWNVRSNLTENVNYFYEASAQAMYEKSLLCLWYGNTLTDGEIYVIEPAQTVNLPTVHDGKYVTWMYMEDDKIYNGTYTVPSDLVDGTWITLEAVYGDAVPEVPGTNVPPTGDTVNVIPYIILFVLGVGVIFVGSKKSNIIK